MVCLSKDTEFYILSLPLGKTCKLFVKFKNIKSCLTKALNYVFTLLVVHEAMQEAAYIK